MRARWQPAPGAAPLMIAVAIGSAVAHLCTSALPFQVGALVDGYGLSASGAGLFGFFQVGALAASMVLLSPVANRYAPARACLLGMGVAIGANLLIYAAPSSLPLLCLFGVAAGIGYGIVLTAAVAGAAAADNPDRVYAAGNSGSLLLAVVMLSLLPPLGAAVGAHGNFVAVAILILSSTPFVAGFRGQRSVRTEALPNAGGMRKGVPLLAIWSLFSLGTGGMWAFAERIGVAIHLPPPIIGLVLSASIFTGLIGTGLAALVAGSRHRVALLAIGLIGGGLTCLAFAAASSLAVYVAAAILYWVFTMFAYVLLLGTAAAIDPSGRLGTLGTGCERLSFAIGAPIAGWMVDAGSVLAVGIAAAACCALVAPMFLPGVARLVARRPVVAATMPPLP